jgi:hypothetical protein
MSLLVVDTPLLFKPLPGALVIDSSDAREMMIS